MMSLWSLKERQKRLRDPDRPRGRSDSDRCQSSGGGGGTEPGEDDSSSDEWEVIGEEAPRQMPSQQYYPPPGIMMSLWSLKARQKRLRDPDRPRGRSDSDRRRQSSGGGGDTEPREDGSSSDEWEVIGAEASRQMPSQQYYPPPLTDLLKSKESSQERSGAASKSAGKDDKKMDWAALGLALAADIDACLDALDGKRPAGEPQQRQPKGRENSQPRGAGREDCPEEQLWRPSAPPAPQVPEVCYRHPGCQTPVCHRLHICLLFLADLCPHGDRCFRGHSLATAHNQRVWDRVASDADSEAERVALLFSYYQQIGRLPDWLYRNNLRLCLRPACDGACRRLHLCRDWVAGECFRSSCKFSHTLRSEHNAAVLRRFHLAEEGDTALLRLLEDRCTAQRHQSDQCAAGRRSGQTGPLTESADPLSQELECAVCLELFRRATTLGCGHTFCADCVRSTRRCPLCRAPVTSAARSVTLDSIIGSLSAAQGADGVTGALYPELGHTGPH
ncbi:uncharacterized protein LOC122384155 [Amphibalanus amphitrite]|uniref:uncharacterized protein LOC122384155 n=1 Tax=Amphibalanus amphitrite TaxID=1232801 RepID=UPI001C9038DE|nr:uncharacterized protein LOC122384155 [Amphibalanus amphitrite]